MKYRLFVSVILFSLSTYAFTADSSDESSAKAEATPQSDPVQQQDAAQAARDEASPPDVGAAKAPERPSLADFCRTHTC
ncbi:MAG: hypothetical protein PHR16_01595 [Methylovulum sp.]|nr:hypothetical protein [Methylovulum sp.]